MTADGHNPRWNHQHAHLHAHVWLEEKKRQLAHPQTNPRKSDSASPDDAKSVQEKETSSWIASWHVCRSCRQTNDCDDRESGILPDAVTPQTR